MKIALLIILLVAIAASIIAIYDARKIGDKLFGTADKNKVTKLIKIFGFIICVICSIIFCILNKRLYKC